MSSGRECGLKPYRTRTRCNRLATQETAFVETRGDYVRGARVRAASASANDVPENPSQTAGMAPGLPTSAQVLVTLRVSLASIHEPNKDIRMKLHLRAHRLALAAMILLGASLAVQAQTSSPSTSGSTPGSSSSGMGMGSSGTGMGYSSGSGTAQSAGTAGAYGGSADAYSLLPFTRRGYVGFNVGRPTLNVGCGSGGYTCDDPDVSGYFYTGGLVNDWLGAEAGYFNSGKADRAGGRTRSQGVNLSAVFRAPLGQFNVFGKVGGMYGETKVSTGVLSNVTSGTERGWGPVYGGGVGFDFTPSSGVVLEFQRHEFRYPGAGGRQDVDNTSVGYVYRF